MGGKSKGGNFEREVAVLLSRWWTDGERDDVFYRSQSSGGRFTSRKKIGKDTALQGGDITASDPIGEPLVKKWSLEIKTGYGKNKKIKDKEGEVVGKEMIRWDVLDFLDSRQKEPELQKMWEQCRRDADLTDRNPILIFRRNGRAPCIMFNVSYLFLLVGIFGKYYGDCMELSVSDFECVIIPLNNFFEWIPNIRAAI